MAWVQLDLSDDPLEPYWRGDPAALHDALGDLLELLRPPAWYAQAECASGDVDVSTFFPTAGANTIAAKALCGRCVVRGECQATAVADPMLHGVWGGLSARERNTVRRGTA